MNTVLIRTWRLNWWKNKGVALMIAISVLGIFALLGMYYVRDGETELKRTVLLIDEQKASVYAKAGLNSAIAELEKARQTDSVSELLKKCPLQYEFPYYKQVWKGDGNLSLEPSDTVQVKVWVQIYDESGKININCSLPSVLQKILKIDGATARHIVSNLPTQNVPMENKRWLYVVDELFDRGLITRDKIDKSSLQFISTWNAGDPEKPQPYLNVNIAPAEVLMALFNINEEEVQKVITGRPIRSIGHVAEILGKDPNTFNFRMDNVDENLPFPFTTKSSSFRLVVKAELSRVVSGRTYNRTYASFETGIVFVDDIPKIVWNKKISSENI